MDYVVGGVAALITGNVTPNRPRLIKKALTPVKHQTSPNVTPKSQMVDDKSMFLSPTLQKKKAIVKKSPKRIFQNDDMNNSNEDLSTKADKVKKHLKDDLESDNLNNSSKSKKHKHDSQGIVSPKKKKSEKHESSANAEVNENNQNKKSKQPKAEAEIETLVSKKSKKKKTKHIKNKEETKIEDDDFNIELQKKKSKKNKKNKNKNVQTEENKSKTKTDNSETYVNPNAITQQDTDSEHESDNELESETEQDMKEQNSEDPAQSSDEEEPKDQKVNKKLTTQKTVENENEYHPDENEVKRTIFVGNVPFSKKCKKEIKKIFSKHGAIDSVRIRAVPVKDSTTTRKLAVIKNELHPDRSTVNVYVKFQDENSVAKALSENNTLLGDCHLRVGRSDHTGAHDSRLALFVGNLPFSIEDETLRAMFEKCGDIQSVRVIRDKKTNIGKGFGYVNFASKDGVELALSLSEAELMIKNRILRVDRCKTRSAQGNAKRNKFGQNKGRDFGNSRSPKNSAAQRQDKEQIDGAHRRILNKRKSQESADVPPPKRQKDAGQPIREKKQRKEFVGITAEKKKKKNFNKGQKKKKIISELLS